MLASCVTREPLAVKQFTVKEVNTIDNTDLMVRGELQKRLYGAIDQKDREDRKGQYYSVRWRANPTGGPVEVKFQYRQAATGSRSTQISKTVPAAGGTGLLEFAVAGEAYRKQGRVIAWQVLLSQDGVELGQKKSFLWE